MASRKKSAQMVAHAIERNSVNGAGVWASDTAYLQHTIHKVTAVQKMESDRSKTFWRKWGGRECSTRTSFFYGFVFYFPWGAQESISPFLGPPNLNTVQ